MVVRTGLLIALLCLSLNVFAKGFTAQVDRLSVGLGDQIQLVLTLADIQGSRPDTSVLDKDFTILQRSQSSNLKVINGVVSQEVKWVFLLSPKRKGTLTIPAFISGSFKSVPISIEVGDVPVGQSTSDDVLLEVEVKPLNPYVKGQAIYTQRLYFSGQLVGNASLDNPKLAEGDAEIIFLGSSNPRYVKRNGKPYQLIERYYSVFPSSAGELLFTPSVFRGSVAADSQQSRSNRFMFNTGKRVTAYSSRATLSISDQPVEFTGRHWLPTSQLSLDINWSQPPETLKAGEPVTVTIMLMAEGLKAETLPEVTLNWPSSMKTYPEKPEFRTDKRANGVVGLRQEKVVLVANQNGEFQIPIIEVPWWNTVTNQQQVERIGGFGIKVAGGVAALQLAPDQVAEVPSEKIISPELTADDSPIKIENSLSMAERLKGFYIKNSRTSQVGLAAFCVLCMIGFYVFYRLRQPETLEKMKRKEVRFALDELSLACKENSTKAAIIALPKWANAVGIYPPTLAGVECCDDEVLAREVTRLSQARYGQSADSWDGEGLITSVERFSCKCNKEDVKSELGSLHPLY